MNDVADLMMRFKTEGEGEAIRALNQVDRGITEVDHSARSAKTGLGGMFQTAGGFVIGGAVNMIAGSIMNIGKGILFANANAEQSIMSLETVMGSTEAAKAKFEELQAFAAKTPFAFPELVTSAINLEAFGIKSSEWIDTIGDTASAMGKSVDQVTQAVLDAQGGQYERLKELGIMASVEGDKVNFKYMKDGQQIVETVDRNNQEIINSTIQGIWNDKYDGAMEKQSNSFIGRWSTLKDNINMKLQEVSGGIFGFASGAIGILNSVFANGFFDTFDGILGPSVTGFLKNLADIGTGIIDAFGQGKGVKELIDGLPASWQPAASAIFRISDSIGDLWDSISEGDFSQFFRELGKELQTMGQAGIDLGEIVIRATFKLASSVDWASIGRDVVDGLRGIDWASFIGPDSFNVGVTVGAAIRENVVRFIRGLTWDNVVSALKAGLIGAIAIPGAFIGLAAQTASVIGGVFAGLVFGDDVNFNNVGDKISSAISSHMTVASFAAVGTKALEGINSAVAALGDLEISWPNALTFDFDVPELGKFPSWSDVFDIAWDGLRGLGNMSIGWPNSFSLDFRIPSLGSFPSWNDIYNLAWNGLKALGDLSIGWPNAFNVNFPSPGGGIPYVPGYADGGVTVGGLAMVGERGPELVRLPAGSYVHTASQTAAMLNRRGGGGDYYDLRGSIIGADVMRAIDERIAAGQGKRTTRAITSRRLQESY